MEKTVENKNLETNTQEKDEIENVESDSKADSTNSNDKYNVENIHYEGDVAIYTDPDSKFEYSWCKEKQEWVPRSKVSYGFENDTHTYTDADGAKFFWDKEKNAWFPKIDDEFMAIYQLNYGFTQPESTDNKQVEVSKPIEKPKKSVNIPQPKGVQSEPSWFEVDDSHNTNVYVSNLPLDLTEEEFVEFMSKCGLIMRDGSSSKMKIKMYTDSKTKNFKGDALCSYIRIESVKMALEILDGSNLKGNIVKVERAKFQMKGKYDPTLKPKKRKRKDKEKMKRQQEKLFDWRPEKLRGERAKHERVVIVKNLFESSMFDENVSLILEFQEDLREECSKCGEVRKVVIFDRHPEGVAQINMKEPEEAEAVVTLLNGRWFCKRQLTAEIWDGKTKFKIAETDSQISQRLEKWDKFLESEEKNVDCTK